MTKPLSFNWLLKSLHFGYRSRKVHSLIVLVGKWPFSTYVHVKGWIENHFVRLDGHHIESCEWKGISFKGFEVIMGRWEGTIRWLRAEQPRHGFPWRCPRKVSGAGLMQIAQLRLWSLWRNSSIRCSTWLFGWQVVSNFTLFRSKDKSYVIQFTNAIVVLTDVESVHLSWWFHIFPHSTQVVLCDYARFSI